MTQTPAERPDEGPEGQVHADDPAGPDADLDAGTEPTEEEAPPPA